MSPEDRPADQAGGTGDPRKKRYEPPTLVAYGDIAAIIKTVGLMGTDGGTMGTSKGTAL